MRKLIALMLGVLAALPAGSPYGRPGPMLPTVPHYGAPYVPYGRYVPHGPTWPPMVDRYGRPYHYYHF